MNNVDASKEAVIVAAARTAVGRAKRGSLATTRPDEMAAVVIADLLNIQRLSSLDNRWAESLVPDSISCFCFSLIFKEI
jgi:acetyl-CoA acyltransferase